MKTPDTQIKPAPDSGRMKLRLFKSLKPLSFALAMGLAASANADTTIANGSTQSVSGNPLTTFWNAAGIVTMENGSALDQFTDQSAPPTGWVITNDLVLSGGAGTVILRFNGNDTKWDFAGPVSSTATGNQIIEIRTGNNGNGDREDVIFSTPVPDGASGTTGFNVFYNTQSDSLSYFNLSAVNTFTGPITTNQPNGASVGRFVVGGERYSKAFDPTLYTVPGSGSLGPAGDYPGNVSLATRTILDFNTSADQTMSGVISGAGSVVKEVAGSTLTLTGPNTYTGNTTVDAGTLVLSNDGVTSFGELKFVVTNATSNKITGAGTATLDGVFTIDTSAVTIGAGSWPLVDTSTKSFGSNFSVASPFTGPVGGVWTYVNGAQIFQFNSNDGKLYVAGPAEITSFGIPGSVGVIDQGSKTIALTVPYNPWGISGLATLNPAFSISSGSASQTSEAPPSPSFAAQNPVQYVVTDVDTDPDTVNDYTVTVTVTPASTGKTMSNVYFPGYGYAWASDNTGTDPLSLLMVVPATTDVTTLAPTFSFSPFASVDVPSGTARDFTTSKTYTVTAEDGSSQVYTLAVQKITATGTGTYQQNVLASGPVSYWPLNETSGTAATDLATGINPITYAGTYTLNQTGLRPDGNPSVHSVASGTTGTSGNPVPASLNAKQFTVEAWVKPTNTNVQYLVSIQDRTTGPRLGFALWKNNGSSGFGLMAGNGSAGGVAVNGATVAAAGTAYHVVGTYDGTTLKLYVNGNLEGSVPLPNYVPAALAQPGFTIGSRNGVTGDQSDIQDVAVYTRALSQAEIQAHTGYTVTYSGNGSDSGSVPSGPVVGYTSGQTVTVLDNTNSLALTGSTFDGWNTQADGLGTSYSPAATFSISANTTLYAKWSAPSNDYDTWAAVYLPIDVSDPAGDNDGDGLTNREEYAFGLNPTSGASVSPITQQLDKGTGIFKYTRRATPATTGLTYIYEWSTSLVGTWGTFTPVTDPPASDSGTPVEEITIEVPAAQLANPTLFVRVRAE